MAKDRKKRIKLIIEHLQASSHDIVGLQELWIKSDWQKLQKALKEVFPHSHYFRSGVMGSGLAVLSRYPITQAFFHRFSLNGVAHRIWHGDWWGGKGVGGVRIKLNLNGNTPPSPTLANQTAPVTFYVDFYVTHLHAEYTHEVEKYQAHRLVQLHELVQYVHHTTRPSHLCVVVGDFNTQPHQLPYQLFLANAISPTWHLKILPDGSMQMHPAAPLLDGWQQRQAQVMSTLDSAKALTDDPIVQEQPDDEGFTFGLPTNSYGKRRGSKQNLCQYFYR